MKNPISIVEIPTVDFPRAVTFYQSVLDISIEEVNMGDIRMALFPMDGGAVSVSLIHGSGYRPSVDGAIIYLNAGDDLQITLNKIEANGGKVLMPKSEIAPEMGYYALFIDTEGNRLGVHSPH